MKVLIVDDSKVERARLVEALCQSTQLVVIGAVARLHTALHALADNPPDVLVTDAVLGDEHAVHLIAAARRCLTPPAIVVFAEVDTVDERRRCLEAGADRFVGKAAGIPALERAISDAHEARLRTRPSVNDRFSLIGRIAAGAAHDLNNYLGVLDVSLARLEKREQQARADEVTALRRTLESAIRLTANMTRYARGSSPPLGCVEVGAVARRVLELFGRSFTRDVQVVVEADDVCPVDGVELELEQLVLNLVLNAVDASPDGGTVHVRLHAPEPAMVRLEITDRGPGLGDVRTIDGALSRSTKRDTAGLGLGIVRAIAGRHGAALRFHDAAPGTRVTVDFACTQLAAAHGVAAGQLSS